MITATIEKDRLERRQRTFRKYNEENGIEFNKIMEILKY